MNGILTYRADERALARVIQNWDKSSLGVLTGNAEIYRLAHIWITRLIESGFIVHVIDCAIRFNVYRVINETNTTDIDLHQFLERGIVRRAFTPYQILDVCYEILEREHLPNHIYFILAPSKQFFDGDVKDREGFVLLDKLITVFEQIQARQIPVVAVESKKYKNKTFQFLFPRLFASANTTWEYDTLAFGRETLRRFEISYKNPMFGITQYRLEIPGGENGTNSNALF